MTAASNTPFVSLIGAGPGDPGLLTLRGVQALQAAEVVLFDHLANPALLRHCPHAETIYVGKQGFSPATTQDEIHALMLQKALENGGRRVARLKGGDPFVFGRGGEEAAVCARAGIPCEVIPGVSSALAAPAAAGIPVTHRGVARSFAVLTGNDQRGPAQYADVAGVDTLVILMGMHHLPALCAELIRAGRPAHTPAAAVQWATLPGQRSVTATLATLPDAVSAAHLGAPAVVIVGDVVGLQDELGCFTPPVSAPLAGRNVVVTRTRPGHSPLADLLTARGANVTELPLLHFTPPGSPKSVIGALRDYPGWLLFSSEYAVNATLETLLSHGLDARTLRHARLAAAGHGTAHALRQRGLNPDFLPPQAGARHLGATLPAQPDDTIVHCGSQHPDQTLERTLAGRDLPYFLLETFRTAPVPLTDTRRHALQDAHVVTVASSTGAQELAALLNTLPDVTAPIVAIGPQTAEAAHAAGLSGVTVAPTADLNALADAVGDALNQPAGPPVLTRSP